MKKINDSIRGLTRTALLIVFHMVISNGKFLSCLNNRNENKSLNSYQFIIILLFKKLEEI